MRGKYEIQRIPLAESAADFPKFFESQPQMYLELLENKSKTRTEVVNQSFVPSPARAAPRSPTPPATANIPITFHPEETDSVHSSKSLLTRSPSPPARRPSPVHKRAPPSPVPAAAAASPRKSSYSQAYSRKYGGSRGRLPTLDELEKKGLHREREVVNVARLSTPEEDAKKRELLFKMDLLKNAYPDVELPKFNIYDSFESMRASYDGVLKRLCIENNVSEYKQYLSYAFMGTEYVLGKWAKLDMAGFTQQQLANAQKYDALLLELGEKNYAPEGDGDWPIEVRLGFTLIMNTAFFIIGKMLMKRASNKPATKPPEKPAAPATKLRGPSVVLNKFNDQQVPAAEPVKPFGGPPPVPVPASTPVDFEKDK